MIRFIPGIFAQKSDIGYSGRFLCLTFLLLTCALSETASAQTLFRWPDSNVDVTQYSYLENCRVAGRRVADSIIAEEKVLSDTIEQTKENADRPLAPPVSEIIDRCMSRYDVSKIPLDEALLAQEIYLMAGRDRDAELIVQRRLAAIPTVDIVTRAHFMDSVARQYLKAMPRRLEMGKKFADSIIALGKAVPTSLRLGVDLAVFFAGVGSNDWPTLQKGGSRFLQTLRERSNDERGDPMTPVMNAYAAGVSRTLFQAELLDSLKSSTDAYVRLQNRIHTSATKDRDFDRAIGERVATLTGDFWFPDSAKQETYPRRGKTTLIYFERAAHTSTPDYQMVHAVLRRVGKAFPEVDVVIVAHTLGYFGNLEPPPPEKEAFLLDTLIRKFYKIPGVLAITRRSAITLEEPDRRKLRYPPENVTNYPGQAINCLFLVDPDGRLLWYQRATITQYEKDLNAMLVALRERSEKQQ